MYRAKLLQAKALSYKYAFNIETMKAKPGSRTDILCQLGNTSQYLVPIYCVMW